MFKKKGIALKTFLFTAILIVVVGMVSFGLLYAIMPDYYYYQKQKTITQNISRLVNTLDEAEDILSISASITDFCTANNASVSSYNEQGAAIPLLSWPVTSIITDYMDIVNLSHGDDLRASEDISISIQVDDTIYAINSDLYGYLQKYPVAEAASDTYYITVEPITESEYDTFVLIDDERNDFSLSAIYREDELDGIMYATDVDNALISYITIEATIQPIDEAKGVILSLAPYLLGLDIVIAFIAAYFYARSFTKPIIQISDAAVQMQNLEGAVSSNIRTNDELGVLSENLDMLYQKLRSNINSLKTQMDIVTRLEKSKTDFLQAASHELKTPLAGLNGIVEGMIDAVGKYKDRDIYLVECKKQIDRMTGLVHEILNASRLEGENIELSYEKIHINELIEEILETYSLFLQEKNISLIYDSLEMDFSIVTDRNLFKNVLSNVVSNAVKYTSVGGVIMIGSNDSLDFRDIYVENQCAPIPEDSIQRLFEPFYTGNYSRDKNQSGTGLGLYIVKKNLDRLGLKFTLAPTTIGLRFSIQL